MYTVPDACIQLFSRWSSLGFFAIIFYSQRNKYNKYVEIISRIVCYNKDFEFKKKMLDTNKSVTSIFSRI